MARQLVTRGGLVQSVERPKVKQDYVDVLDFGEKNVIDISFETLTRTHKENGVDEQPILGIYHDELIGGVMQLAKQAHYNPQLKDLFAANGGASTMPGVSYSKELQGVYGVKSTQSATLRRVYANISLPEFDDGNSTMNMAVSFHQGGIELGFGPMVHICHNQTMLGAKDHFTFHKSDVLNGDMQKKVVEWFGKAEQICQSRRHLIEVMKARAIDVNELTQTIGLLTTTMVSHNSKKIKSNSGEIPLTNKQLNLYTEQLILRGRDKADGEPMNVWDLYDASTELYQPAVTDQPRVLNQNESMVEFLSGIFPEVGEARKELVY